MKTSTLLQLISALLILLFVYTAVSKLLDFNEFKNQIYNQALPRPVETMVIWALPGIELITCVLLVFDRTKKIGFYVSSFLMTLFTGYIALILLHFFNRVPCSCGGVIKSLGWKMHLLFNLFFMLLSFLGIYFTNRERSIPGKET